jgi:hypothetical protein
VVLAHGHRRDRQATIVGAAACRDSLLGWLLLAASCNGLAAAVVRWNPQWLAVLALPVLALLVPPAWQQPPG